jgi:hypothetical protein
MFTVAETTEKQLEVTTASWAIRTVPVHKTLFWHVTPCSLVEVYKKVPGKRVSSFFNVKLFYPL